MRYGIFLLISNLLLSCQPNLEIQGFWVGIDEDGNWNHQTIEVTADSMFIYHYFGMPLKSTYSMSGSKIKSGTTYQLFSNERFNEGGEVEVEVANDTLYWKLSSTPDKYVRSRFNSYVEHYANSKGLKIELPKTDLYTESNFNNYSYVDLFIGFDRTGSVQMKLNDAIVNSYEELPRLLDIEKDFAERSLVLRVFADDKVKMEPLHELHESMKKTNVTLIHYVSKSTTRILKNLNQNPYSNSFYGNKILIRNTPRIKIFKETTSNKR